jgi:hypothetical protein
VRRLVTALALLALLDLVAGAGAAHADPAPLPTGDGCGWDSFATGSTFRSVVFGSVEAAALPPSDATANPVSVTLVCTLHVYGSSPDPAVEAAGTGTAAAVVAPVAVTYDAAETDTVAFCSTAYVRDASGATYTYHQDLDNGWWYPYDVGCSSGRCTALGPQCDHTMKLAEWLLDQVGTVPGARS